MKIALCVKMALMLPILHGIVRRIQIKADSTLTQGLGDLEKKRRGRMMIWWVVHPVVDWKPQIY